ncbi:hypothetical protein ACHAXS_006105 [Conticribra weissflogii]
MASHNLSMDEEKPLTSIAIYQELVSSSTSITLGTLDQNKKTQCLAGRNRGVVDLSPSSSPQHECSQEPPRLSSSYQIDRCASSATDPVSDVEYVPGGNGVVTVVGSTEGTNNNNDLIDEIAGDDARGHIHSEEDHQSQSSFEDQRQDIVIFPVDNFRDQDVQVDISTHSTVSRGDDSSVAHDGFPPQNSRSDDSANTADVRSGSEIESEDAPPRPAEQDAEILSPDCMLDAQVTLADESMVSNSVTPEEIHQQIEMNENASVDEEVENTIPIAVPVEAEEQDVDFSLSSEESHDVNPLVGMETVQFEDSDISESFRHDESENIYFNPTLLNALSSDVALARLGDEGSLHEDERDPENGARSTSFHGNSRNDDFRQGNAMTERNGSEGTAMAFVRKGNPFTKRIAFLFLVLLFVVAICVAVPLLAKSDEPESLSNYEMASSSNDPVRGDHGKGNEGGAPTSQPILQLTSNPTSPFDPVDSRSALTAELLMPILEAGENRYRVRGSPQHQAFEWVKSTTWNSNETILLIDWTSDSVDAAHVSETTEGVYSIDDIPNQTKLLLQQSFTKRYVLALFYFDTGGEDWIKNSGFLSNSHECDWNYLDGNFVRGVECDEDGNVVAISLGKSFGNSFELGKNGRPDHQVITGDHLNHI